MKQKESAGKNAIEAIGETNISDLSLLWRILKFCVKAVWLVMLNIGALAFWIIVIFITIINIIPESPKQSYTLANGYSAVGEDYARYFDIKSKSGYSAVKNAYMVCIEGNFLHGQNNDSDPNDEGYFVLDTSNGELYKSPKFSHHEEALKEYLLVIADNDLHPCTEKNAANIPFSIRNNSADKEKISN